MKKLSHMYSLTQTELKKISQFLPDKEPVLSGNRIIPVCEPDIRGLEKRLVLQAINSSWISSAGDFVEMFEKEFSQHVSMTSYAYAVNSGTSALHVALAALGIQPGDEVIMPTFTMVATANAVRYCGATPVLVDADALTWNVNIGAIEAKITPKTKAIIVVHTYGLPVQMDQVLRIARKHDLWVVEDAAEAHGAMYKGVCVGGLGDVSAFSFYANKLITTGEGGMVATNSPEIAKRIDLLRNHAFSPERHFWHTMVGFGYRMTNLQAAVGVAQVRRFASMLRTKQANARKYRNALAGIPGVILPYESTDTTHSYWMFGICIDQTKFGMSKNMLRDVLAKKGIESRSFFIPVHMQPAYFHTLYSSAYPVSSDLCRDGLYLPSSTRLTGKDIAFISGTIRGAHLALNS